jgi:hypothetical protein
LDKLPEKTMMMVTLRKWGKEIISTMKDKAVDRKEPLTMMEETMSE